MTSPASNLFVDSRSRKLVLGSSFKSNSYAAFHTARYDFKPASVDKQREGVLEMGSGNEVTICLPHVQGSKTSCTVYKGSKKPAQKECVLIYDNAKCEFTLERITCQIQVKKTRDSGSANFTSNPTHPVAPRLIKPPRMQSKSAKSAKRKSCNPVNPDLLSGGNAPTSSNLNKFSNDESTFTPSGIFSSNQVNSSSSSNKSSSDVESESSSDENDMPKTVQNRSIFDSQLQEDLELSESGSDSE